MATHPQLTIDTVSAEHIRALRDEAFAHGDEKLADTCTVAIGTVGQTDAERDAAIQTCVDAINAARAQGDRPIRYAIVNTVTRSVIFVCEAASANAAIELAVVGLDRTKASASWWASPIAHLPADLHREAASWRLEERS